ncbi:hypothetical protein DFH09DRAFT_1368227 [Mycena vulgaris]|nr:hypothetical protein DFH09DRAFT_1368227 [Mycena vulgaris]
MPIYCPTGLGAEATRRPCGHISCGARNGSSMISPRTTSTQLEPMTPPSVDRPLSWKVRRTSFCITLPVVSRNKLLKNKAAALAPIIELEEPEPGEDETQALPMLQDICNTPGDSECSTPNKPLCIEVRRSARKPFSRLNSQTTPTIEFTSLCLTEEMDTTPTPSRRATLDSATSPHAPHHNMTDESTEVPSPTGNRLLTPDRPARGVSRKRTQEPEVDSNEGRAHPGKRQRVDVPPAPPPAPRKLPPRRRNAPRRKASAVELSPLPLPLLTVDTIPRAAGRKRAFEDVEESADSHASKRRRKAL